MSDREKIDFENNKSEHIDRKTDFNSVEKIDVEDATEYGEFIPSFYQWNTLEDQKKIVNRLQNITDKKENNKKK